MIADMRSPVPDYLQEILDACRSDEGQVATYIPELAHADPGRYGIALATVDGMVYAVGDSDVPFSIQSISKAFVYGIALADRGLEAVEALVDVEPSGEPFDELSLEAGSGRPRNPMINAGALATHSLVGPEGTPPEDRVERIITVLSACAGRTLTVDEDTYRSEMATADRNFAIAHMLRSRGTVTDRAETVVAGYVRQCSVRVTARDLAVMAATLANGGVQPLSGERIFSRHVTRQVLSVMLTCGMYDSAGDWVSTVGMPAKSGVAGGLIGALPGQAGLASFAPRLDAHGSSVGGVRAFERLSHDMGLHLMETVAPARSVLREDRVTADGSVRVIALSGVIRFAAAERVLRHVAQNPPAEPTVAFDLGEVHSMDGVARRMLLEMMRRLRTDDREVVLVDDDDVLPAPDPGDGRVIPVLPRVPGE